MSGFWYIGSPYTKYPLGQEAAFRKAVLACADLLKAGIPAFSPIVHSHPIGQTEGIDALSHEFWVAADAPFVEAAHGLIVRMMDGWEESLGLAHEMREFRRMKKPVVMWPLHLPVASLSLWE